MELQHFFSARGDCVSNVISVCIWNNEEPHFGASCASKRGFLVHHMHILMHHVH